MSMTIGFVVRYDRAPSAPVQPVTPIVAARHAWSAPKADASVQPVAQASWHQPAGDHFPAYASTTYGSRGEPNRPWVPSRTRLDLYA
jgi:hypothetical protein